MGIQELFMLSLNELYIRLCVANIILHSELFFHCHTNFNILNFIVFAMKHVFLSHFMKWINWINMSSPPTQQENTTAMGFVSG